jgi:AraC family transcriptional regulator of adaptative response/methylated-DNA-[protein]-cysteine methyltransferase
MLSVRGRCYDTFMTSISDPRYEALANRTAGGEFWYGVRTTGVFCRPTCKSRLPRPENVEFFTRTAAAMQAGFRPCKRCKPLDGTAPDATREKVMAACRFIERAETIPTLAEIGAAIACSPSHLQRAFTRTIGLSPRAYAEALRTKRLKTNLRAFDGVADATYESGFGSSSRVYERAGQTLGMTPARYRRGGPGLTITFSIVPSSLGHVLVAATSRGICSVRLGDDAQALEDELRREFAHATIARADRDLAQTVTDVLAYVDDAAHRPDLPLDIRATAFQERVWKALREIAPGTTATYSQLAAGIGQPGAARAVAAACAANPVALLVPCHRVVGKTGSLTGYRWGLNRKREILARERKSAT